MDLREKNTEAENFIAHTFGFRQFLSRPQSNTLRYKILSHLSF